MKFNHLVLAVTMITMLTGCLGRGIGGLLPIVHQADLDAWVDVPVSELDTHPEFLTMRLERTVTSDGTEVRNYINERTVPICVAEGVCTQRRIACNNIFYIKYETVREYRPTPSGGARCYTHEGLQPQRRFR